MTTKKCTRCGIEKSLDEFSFHKTGKFHRNSRCKPCVVLSTQEWCEARKNSMHPIKCGSCGEHKPASSFPSGYSACKKCCAAKVKAKKLQTGPPATYREFDTKPCSLCGLEKPPSEFHSNIWAYDGRMSRCKDCTCNRGRHGPFLCSVCKHLKPKGDFRVLRRVPKTECKDCERSGLRCSRCKMFKPHGDFSPDKQLSTGRASWCRECAAKHLLTARGKASRRRRKSRRRAREGPIQSILTADEWQEILDTYGNRCAYCGRRFGDDLKPTQDHFVPLSRGGHHVKDNIVPACLPCNMHKFTKVLPAKPCPVRQVGQELFA